VESRSYGDAEPQTVEDELDTLEVYPLKGYGAVEIGIHRFHHPGHPEDGEGDAKFITIWQNKDGDWKVTRVISYYHNHGLLAK